MPGSGDDYLRLHAACLNRRSYRTHTADALFDERMTCLWVRRNVDTMPRHCSSVTFMSVNGVKIQPVKCMPVCLCIRSEQGTAYTLLMR